MNEFDAVTKTAPSESDVARRSWRNWSLLVAVSLMTTGGLAVAAWPLIGSYIGDIWPWVTTGSALLVGLLVSMGTLAAYLTYRERQLMAMRQRIQELQAEAVERAQRNYSRLLGLFNVSRLIGSDTDLQAVFDCITRICTESFDCERASFMVLDPATDELIVRSAVDHIGGQELIGSRRKVGEGIAGWVAANRKPLLLGAAGEGIDNYMDLSFKPRSMTASMVVPVLVKDQLVGVLSVSTEAENASYEEDDLRVLWVFADHAGAWIKHRTDNAPAGRQAAGDGNEEPVTTNNTEG